MKNENSLIGYNTESSAQEIWLCFFFILFLLWKQQVILVYLPHLCNFSQTWTFNFGFAWPLNILTLFFGLLLWHWPSRYLHPILTIPGSFCSSWEGHQENFQMHSRKPTNSITLCYLGTTIICISWWYVLFHSHVCMSSSSILRQPPHAVLVITRSLSLHLSADHLIGNYSSSKSYSILLFLIVFPEIFSYVWFCVHLALNACNS